MLIIAMIAMGIVGGALFSLDSAHFTLRSEREAMDEYNILQDYVEEAQAFLKKDMGGRFVNSGDKLLHWSGYGSSETIDDPDELLLCDPVTGAVVGDFKDEEVTRGNLKGRITVKIYDMDYKTSDIDPSMSAAQRAQLPPVLTTKGGGEPPVVEFVPVDPYAKAEENNGPSNTGSYLIRATFTNDSDEAQRTMEVALMQATGDDPAGGGK
jgi:hypothetical protein